MEIKKEFGRIRYILDAFSTEYTNKHVDVFRMRLTYVSDSTSYLRLHERTAYLLNIAFVLDTYLRSWAVVTTVILKLSLKISCIYGI